MFFHTDQVPVAVTLAERHDALGARPDFILRELVVPGASKTQHCPGLLADATRSWSRQTLAQGPPVCSGRSNSCAIPMVLKFF